MASTRKRQRGAHPGAVAVRELPVLPVEGDRRTIAKSRTAKWRAAVLLGVHVLILAHVTHYLVTGRTISPIEPSEAMYALELGQVNAGFVFFGLAILSTAIFGRFFCGWGCHVVALQDACAWLVRKAGLRLQPFRSRLLLFAPLLVALYMFAWPGFRRLVLREGPAFPGFSDHLVTDDFWRTFPGPVFAVLTFLVCGVIAVLLLGSKGFCTYGCPYGAFFAAADRLAPVRIVANDNCQQSGHCTATCTSNVTVHEQVQLHRMVVDPACMKCMDCVSVCPTQALSVGLARPSLFAPAPATPPARRFPLTLGEELLVGLVALGATLAFRGLYDGPPLLMAVGLGAITGFLALQLWRLARRPPVVRVQSLVLATGGRLSRAGAACVVLGLGWMAFTAHSGFVQWHRVRGRAALERTEAPRADVLAGRFDASRASAMHRDAQADAARHFDLADRYGLVPVAEVDLGLAWTHLLAGEPAPAEARIREAAQRQPESAALHENLVELLLARGRLEEAERALEAKIAQAGAAAGDHVRLGALRVHAGRLEQAVEPFTAAAELAPGDAAVRHDLGALLRRLGRPDEAAAQLREAARLAPGDPQTERELALALADSGETKAAAGEAVGSAAREAAR